MNLDTALLTSALLSLLLALGTTLWLGLNQMEFSRAVDAKELERRATERYLRRNLGLD